MNLRRSAAIATGFATAALGLTLGLQLSAGAATTTAATRVAATTAAPQYVVLNCLNKAQVKPGTITLACADDGEGLEQLHWTSWTPELASAYGTEWANDCLPNCASGHVHDYPVLVELWGSATVKGHPAERRFTEATLTYPTKKRPAVYVVTSNHKVVATYPVTQVVPLGSLRAARLR